MHDVVPARISPSIAPAALDVVAAACLVGGNTIGGYLFSSEWMVLGLFPPVHRGVALVAIRCALWPTPSLFQTWRLRAAKYRGLPRQVIAVALLTRAGVLAAGLAASIAQPASLVDSPRISDNPVVTLPARWDAFWYLSIARYGYDWTPDHAHQQQNIAFFPAHPIAMRIAGDLATIPAYVLHAPNLLGGGDGRVLWASVFTSTLFVLIALSGLRRLALEDSGDATAASRACLLLATYPFAVFFSAPYQSRWRCSHSCRSCSRGGGGIRAAASHGGWCSDCAVRMDGASRWRWGSIGFISRPPDFPWRRAWLLILAAPLGAALYSMYIYHLTGDPFSWASAQHAWGGKLQPLEFIFRRWHTVQARGLRVYFRHDPADALSFVAVVWMVAAAVALLARRQWLYGSVILAYLAPAVAIDLPATGRLTAVLFPAFILLGARLRQRWFFVLASLFMAGQVWFACRFFLWKTPY